MGSPTVLRDRAVEEPIAYSEFSSAQLSDDSEPST